MSEQATHPATPEEAVVLAERRGSVLLLTLNRPQRLNAWTQEMEELYLSHLAEADADPEVRAIVVTGAGRAFCAGADLSVLGDLAADAESWEVERERSTTFPLRIRKPLIAAINGACAGVGLVQAMLCDIRFVADEAKLTTAFARRGLVAEYGVSWLLNRSVGRARALDLLLSGRVLRGAEAAAIGLAEFSVPAPEVLERALAYAEDLASNCSPRAMATIKRQAWADLDRGFEEAAGAAETLVAESFTWPDLAEGVASFSARRAPEFPPLAG
jgi:enoyl-CoA hydratase/carnithine racemase